MHVQGVNEVMTNEKNIINCTRFEELLTDYLDKTLDSSINAAVAAHALACPLCHTLLNDVKESLEALPDDRRTASADDAARGTRALDDDARDGDGVRGI